jgi:hypothetical protein
MDLQQTFICAYCGEENDLFVDPEGGAHQVLTEDCMVCCRPNVLTIRIEEKNIFIDSEYEG